jgi:N-ethylmaleimide reductase
LRNRIVMAPLTRNRATHGTDVPHELNATYYAQRASAGLLIAEATQISPSGKGYAWTPGIYNAAQVDGWRIVTDAVHAEGGTIFLQLWHVGRISHPTLQPNGELPVAPSAIAPVGQKTFLEDGTFAPIGTPRALALDEIAGILDDYRAATANALAAGFDGVEIHAANGYLIDQFLRDGANKRTDAYGGSVANRLRFATEVIAAVSGVAGPKRTGIRISPVSPFRGAWIVNNGYTRALAIDAVASGYADLVAFGKAYIANPDLVERLRIDAPLNQLDAEHLYGGGAVGYTDYPALEPATR